VTELAPLVCPLCGGQFGCGVDSGECWCAAAPPPAAALGFSNSVQGCLCPACLASPLALAWSGGKDSVLALDALYERGVRPAALFTTVSARHDRVSIHGVRRELLERQAASLGLPLVQIELPAPCSYEQYAALVAGALTRPPLAACRKVAFGDLFLADVRSTRERELAAIGRAAIFPLWLRDTASLAERFVAVGYEAFVVCVDAAVLPAGLAGRRYDRDFLRDLPGSVDPCGENGEFHTMVLDGPLFSRRVDARAVGVVEREGHAYCDLVASSEAVREHAYKLAG
jgi:uncharacterized protein (TIGR00290 family)